MHDMETPPDRVLLVDDERAVLDALCRQHRKHFTLATACGAEAGLRAIAQEGPFAAVVSDFKMPGMDGIQFLTKVKEIAPDAIRIMLTGQADLRVSVEAVNRGNIFRFLTKPCNPEDFRSCIDAALEQYGLVNAERLLLENTVRGSIEVLAEVLGLANPTAFGRATKIRTYVRHVVTTLNLPDAWQYETAALLSQIGWVAIPDDLIDRLAAGQQLTPEQTAIMDRHPEIACDLLKKIPRLQTVAEIIYHQRPMAAPRSKRVDQVVDLGGQILGAALEFEELLALGATPAQAVDSLRRRERRYDSRVVEALATCRFDHQRGSVRLVSLSGLHAGMILAEDVRNRDEILVVRRGHVISQGSLQRLRNYAHLGLLEKDCFSVRVPTDTDATQEPSAA
jgi:response regulator RpfG family c-di-GMP phosphodiesterase